MILKTALVVLVAMLPSLPPSTGDTGPLVIVGGALDPANEPIYHQILARRLGQRPICVLPTASSRPRRSMNAYVRDFEGYGAKARRSVSASRPNGRARLRLRASSSVSKSAEGSSSPVVINRGSSTSCALQVIRHPPTELCEGSSCRAR